jgi:hypothetical protein
MACALPFAYPEIDIQTISSSREKTSWHLHRTVFLFQKKKNCVFWLVLYN